MNTDNNGQQPITDDAELAKVLEGIKGSAPATDPGQTTSGLQFEEAPIPAADPAAPVDEAPVTYETPSETTLPASDEPVLPTIDSSLFTPSVTTAVSGDLDSIKKDALEELRPLVDKLDLPADEKFDTLLLIIRSTDDQSLVGAAHAVAKTIEDETKRAQALLDIIKEIDFFANQAK